LHAKDSGSDYLHIEQITAADLIDAIGPQMAAYVGAVNELAPGLRLIDNVVNPLTGEQTANTGFAQVGRIQLIGDAGLIADTMDVKAIVTGKDEDGKDLTAMGLQLSNQAHRLLAGMGDDVILGGSNTDVIVGNGGEDWIGGGAGNDILDGGAGNDTIDAGEGNDSVIGGLGGDSLIGNAGNDNMNGGDGDDALYGDNVLGGYSAPSGQDLLYGGEGNDYLYGGKGNDTLVGGNGADFLAGNSYGGTTTDIDKLYGGGGADVFGLGYTGSYSSLDYSGSGYAVIMDFNAAEGDKIRIGSSNSYTLKQVNLVGGAAKDMGVYHNGDLIAVLQDTIKVSAANIY
jgi:Ca2+-binding RTX toxin-like protein